MTLEMAPGAMTGRCCPSCGEPLIDTDHNLVILLGVRAILCPNTPLGDWELIGDKLTPK